MWSFLYYWSKILKKMRGAAISESFLGEGSKVESGSSFIRSSMGRHSFCGYDCEIANADIGNFCSIANSVVIGGGEHPTDWVSTSPVFYKGRDSVRKKFSEYERPAPRRCSIGSDVWIGAGVVVLQGVEIGHGAVVGAGAVVTKSVEPYAVVAGVPARHISYRFDEELIEELLNSRWWERADYSLAKCAREVRNPKKFLSLLSKCE